MTNYPATTVQSNKGDTTTSKNYSAYVVWQNPDVQGLVTYDGFEAKMYWEITPPDFATHSTIALMQANPPKLAFKFQDNSATGLQFDQAPGAAYASQEDVAADAAATNDIQVMTAYDTDICTERWYLSPTAIACVEMKG